MKKEILFLIITFIFFNLFISNSYAYTKEFDLLLETMDIPKQNVLGKVINEDIYNQYQLFVYGSPLDGYSGQRWKNVDAGKWTKNGGIWQDKGIRGEYWILGTNFNGKEVHNHMFPVDIEPPTQPTQWKYAIIPDALESWQATEKYMDDTQKEYMLTQKLMRNNNTYEITVMDIGLEKVRIENYATWKTKGTVYTQRYDVNNKKWAANFMVPPMAGDAELEGYAEFPQGNEYVIDTSCAQINIPIIYGAQVKNLTDYAKKEHVKTIISQLYINGNFIEEVSDIKALQIKNETLFNYNIEESQKNSLIKLNIEVRSTLFTNFITDGPLVDVKNYTLYIRCGETEENDSDSVNNKVIDEFEQEYEMFSPPEITNIKITRIVNGEEKPLLISKKTNKAFICAGQTIKIRVRTTADASNVGLEFDGNTSISTFDELTNRFEWIEPMSRNEKTLYKSLESYNKMYKKIKLLDLSYEDAEEKEFEYIYVIPYNTKQTLHSWSTLREKSNDAFNINENKLFTRINKPYELVFKANGITGTTTERVNLDVFERWDTLYNRDLSKYVKKY